MPNGRRLVLAFAVFVIVLSAGLYRWSRDGTGAGDLYLPLCGAEALLRGTDPYACPTGWGSRTWPTNPLTTVLAAFPFLVFGPVAAPVLFAFISAVLAFALLRQGEVWKLGLFLSLPYVDAFLKIQWSPLIVAVALLPSLLPLALVKPQIGLPIILTRLSCRRVLAVFAFAALTFIVDPTWAWRWLPQALGTFDGFVPVLVLPLGPLLLASAVGLHGDRGRWLLLMALMPQRCFYDSLLLALVPETPRQLLAFVAWGWIGFLALGLWPGATYATLAVALVYLPALVLVLRPLALYHLGRVRVATARYVVERK